MVNGNMCCGVVKDDLMIRVGPDDHEEALARPYTRIMDFTHRPMKKMVYVEPEGVGAARAGVHALTTAEIDLIMSNVDTQRCFGAPENPLMMRYHDHEWGVPIHDDRLLFEFLVLEGVQAGLSWQTILRKRDGYRKAFDSFDSAKVATYGEVERQRSLANPPVSCATG